MSVADALAVFVIILALFFTYTNGFQDGSSVTACAIASRAMSPGRAIALVSLFEFLGSLLGGSAVAGTIQKVTSFTARLDLLPVLASGLIAAIGWNYITKYLRIPSSSTHALVGGVVGALLAAGGTRYIVIGTPSLTQPTGLWKLVITLFVSPLAGFLVGFILFHIATLLLVRATMRVNKSLRVMQGLATAVLAFGHGANDPQKSMGLIMMCLYAVGYLHHAQEIPWYVRVGTAIPMVLGVISLAPGIVHRVGSGIYKLRTLHGLVAEIASGAVVLTGSLTGGPVSASQVISSSVVGVGSAVRAKGVHWLVAKDMMVAWFMTIPASALLAMVLHLLLFRWVNAFL